MARSPGAAAQPLKGGAGEGAAALAYQSGGGRVRSVGGALVVHAARTSDSALYTCTAHNNQVHTNEKKCGYYYYKNIIEVFFLNDISDLENEDGSYEENVVKNVVQRTTTR